jgi:hypothetical protein
MNYNLAPVIRIRSINAGSLVNPLMDSNSIIGVLQQFISLMFHNGGIGSVSKVTLNYIKPNAKMARLFELSEPSDRYYSATVHFHYLYDTPQTWAIMNHFEQENQRRQKYVYNLHQFNPCGYSIWVNAGVGYLLLDKCYRAENTSIMSIDQVATGCYALENNVNKLKHETHKTRKTVGHFHATTTSQIMGIECKLKDLSVIKNSVSNCQTLALDTQALVITLSKQIAQDKETITRQEDLIQHHAKTINDLVFRRG